MGYTSRSRDRYRVLVAGVTGLATFSAVAASGALTGVAARDTALRDQARRQQESQAAAQAAQARAAWARTVQVPPVTQQVLRLVPRPRRTVVHTTVVHRVSSAGVASVGSSPAVSAAAPATAPAPAGQPAAAPPPQPAPPPPPPPPPPPAPSSGS